MYGIFTYIWLTFMVNVGKYTIHGSYGIAMLLFKKRSLWFIHLILGFKKNDTSHPQNSTNLTWLKMTCKVSIFHGFFPVTWLFWLGDLPSTWHFSPLPNYLTNLYTYMFHPKKKNNLPFFSMSPNRIPLFLPFSFGKKGLFLPNTLPPNGRPKTLGETKVNNLQVLGSLQKLMKSQVDYKVPTYCWWKKSG